MSLHALTPPAPPPRPAAPAGAGAGADRFALALPALMAVLLALVPALGKSAGPVFLLALVPLALWAALRDTEKALYVYLAWCWMDGTIRGLFDGSAVAVVARDLVMFAILLGWGARRLRTRHRDPLRVPPGTPLVVLFVVECLLQVANPYSLGLVACLGGFKMHLAFLPLLFIGYDVFRRRAQVRPLLLFLVLATLVIGAVSVVQYRQGPAWTYAHYPGTKAVISQDAGGQGRGGRVDAFKAPGTTNFGGGTGAFIGVALPLTFALILLAGRQGFRPPARAALGACVFVFIVMIFLNSVRSALVSAAVGTAVCGVLAGGRAAARSLLVGGVCVLFGLAGFHYANTASDGYAAGRFGTTFADPNRALHDDRQTFFEQFADLVTRAPLGVGIGRVGGSSQLNVDAAGAGDGIFSEAYLGNMIAETGIPGALLVSAIAALFLARGVGGLRPVRDEDDRLLAAALVATLAVLVANFFFSPVLLGLPGAPVFWLFSAVLLRVYRPEGRRPEAEGGPR